MGKKLNPKRQGIFVWVNGRRVKQSQLLENKIRQAEAQLQALTKANYQLRVKEALQLTILDNFELVLKHLDVLLNDALDMDGPGGSHLVTAALLDIQARELLRQLQPGSHQLGLLPLVSALSGRQCSSTPQVVESTSSTSSSAGSSGCCKSIADAAEEPRCAGMSRTRCCLAQITLEDVREMCGISAQQLAVRFKEAYAEVALVHSCNHLARHAEALEAAVQRFAKLFLQAVTAADQQLAQVLCMNLDTLETQLPPDSKWPSVLQHTPLRPEQRHTIHAAFGVFSQERSKLRQQQQQLVQQVRDLLCGTAQQQQQQQTPSGSAMQQVFLTRGSSTKTPEPCPSVPAAVEGCSRTSDTPVSNDSCIGGTAAAAAADHDRDGGDRNNIVGVSAFGGIEDLDVAMRVEALLTQLLRTNEAMKQLACRLVCLWINLLDAEQHARMALVSYPFIMVIQAICSHIYFEEEQRLCSHQPK